MLGGPTGTPSLEASLSLVAELIEGYVNTMASNVIHYRTWSTLTAALSHFPNLETELELLGSGRNADLMESQLDAL
jgi:hypothetical protein